LGGGGTAVFTHNDRNPTQWFFCGLINYLSGDNSFLGKGSAYQKNQQNGAY
jgi:hypothetical protein